MSPADQPNNDFKVDRNNLYREESYTDLKMAGIRRLTPVLPNGKDDRSRSPVFVGATQLMTPDGVLPLQARLMANNLTEAMQVFPEAMRAALEEMIEQAKKLKAEEASRIIVPGRE